MESHGSFYVNQVQVVCSSMDMLLLLQRMGIDPEGTGAQQVKPKEMLEVSMSLNHAKTLVAMIYDQISTVEASLGAIPLDPENQKRFEAFVSKVKALK